MEKPLRVFCCYARNDQPYLHEMKKHLMALQRQQLIEIKADINISPGTEWEREIRHHLNEATIILLLISADFIASDYCFEKEMQQAITRHEHGTACVLPVIIRPTSWERMPFSKLQALPKEAKPVSTWRNRDEAWADVTEGVREVVNRVKRSPDEKDQSAATPLSSLDPIFDVPELPVNNVDRPAPAQPKRRRPQAVVVSLLLSLVVLVGASIGVYSMFTGHDQSAQSNHISTTTQVPVQVSATTTSTATPLPQANAGVTWHPQKSGTAHDLYRVASSGSLLVAVGFHGTILTSPDGITWTPRTSSTDQILYGVGWSRSLFVAVGTNGTILTSPDGVTWTHRISGTTSSLWRVTSSGSRLVAVGENGTILTSSDGITWTPGNSGITQVLYGVGASHSLFVAVGEQGTILTSSNGITWTPRTSYTSHYLDGVAWSGSFFVVTGDSGIVVTSPDGITWSSHYSGSGEALYYVASSGFLFVAVGTNGAILTSSDGINWTPHPSGTSTPVTFLGVIWSGSLFVVVGTNGTILTSP